MSDPIAMVQAFAELRYGVVAHTLENSVKYGHNLGHTPYYYVWNVRPGDFCVTDARGVSFLVSLGSTSKAVVRVLV